jgi:hypothetical protein
MVLPLFKTLWLVPTVNVVFLLVLPHQVSEATDVNENGNVMPWKENKKDS